jgi:hypothetical protein
MTTAAQYGANLEESRRLSRVAAAKRRTADPQRHRDEVSQWRRDNPERHRQNRMRLAHGPDIIEDFDRMWAEQDGCCYLCDDELTPKTTAVDHDHSCCPAGKSCRACRRGLACHACNTLIGLARDDPARLRQIADRLAAVRIWR